MAIIGKDLYTIGKEADSTQLSLILLDINSVSNVLYKVFLIRNHNVQLIKITLLGNIEWRFRTNRSDCKRLGCQSSFIRCQSKSDARPLGLTTRHVDHQSKVDKSSVNSLCS